MKTPVKITKMILVSLLLGFFIFTPLYAADEYTLLAPLPGIGIDPNCTVDCKTDLQRYLPGAFKLIIGIAAALAFVMITFGGMTYVVSDSINGKEDGRAYITNAVWGLVLVIGAYTILYTINPQILNFDLTIKTPQVKQGEATITPGIPLSGAALQADADVRSILFGVSVNNPPCTMGQTTGCTNVNALPMNAISGLVNMKKECKCDVMITGGTEGGHQTHGPGKAIVDLRPDVSLNFWVWGNANTPPDGERKTKRLNDGTEIIFAFETKGGNTGGTSTGAHWHVVIR